MPNRPAPFNNNRGPGGPRGSGSGGRSSGLLDMPSSGPGGPLMTEHLQLQVSTVFMLKYVSKCLRRGKTSRKTFY